MNWLIRYSFLIGGLLATGGWDLHVAVTAVRADDLGTAAFHGLLAVLWFVAGGMVVGIVRNRAWREGFDEAERVFNPKKKD